MTVLQRSVTRFEPETRDRLDELADQASIALKREVPRTAVVRAAVTDWLATSERTDPARVIEAIRTSLVKRGRKRQ
jgi:predicted transcriptional regulator